MLSALALALLSQVPLDGGAVVFGGDLSVLAPYTAYLPYARVSVIRGWGQGGVSLQTSRAENDINADFDIWHSGRTAGQAWRASNGSLVVGQLEWSGQLSAGGQSAPVAFLATGGASLACQPGAWGCYATVYGGTFNKGFHGAVTLGNQLGNPNRDGGLSLQVLGLAANKGGNTNTYASTVLAVDVYGNTAHGGLIGNYLEPSDFDTCLVTPGFDNPTAELDSPGGFFRPRGMWGYNRTDDWVQLCTARSAQRDGGYERFCTDSNGACAQLPAGVTATATNDALVLTQSLADGGTRSVTLPWEP